MFASDAEALAAAEAAYANYLDVSDQIARDGGANAERLQRFVETSLYQQQLEEYADVRSRELRATGASAFDSFRLESYDHASGEIRAYVCTRVTEVRVIDLAGQDVTPENRNNDLPLQIKFVPNAKDEGALAISQSEVWTGVNFC